MRPSRFSRQLFLGGPGGLVVAALLAAPAARAQTPSPEDMAAARALGTEGVHMADSGDCAGAIPKLTAAEKLFHAPTTLARLGECEIKVGKIVAGTEHLNRVIREPLPPNAPPAFVAARQRAQEVIAPALPRIGKLKIHVDGAPADKVTATVDGSPVSSALFDAARPTDPGMHEVKAVAAGFKPAAASVMLTDGGEASVTLKLEPDLSAAPPPATAPAVATPPPAAAPIPAAPPLEGTPPGAAPAPSAAAPPTPAGTETTEKASAPGAAIAMLVVGGVGVGVGSVFGVLALGSKSTLDGACGPSKKSCPRQSDIDALSTNAWVSNVGFGVGVVGLAIGAILLATHHPEKSATTAPHVTPWIGLGSAGVGGTFE